MKTRIKYRIVSGNEVYTTGEYSLKHLEECSDVYEMIREGDGECVCSLNGSVAHCECGGYFPNSFSCENDFKILERIVIIRGSDK